MGRYEGRGALDTRPRPLLLVHTKFLDAAFFRLVVLRGIPFAKAKALLIRDKRTGQEARIMRLVHQALMSVGELVKCVEIGADDVSTDEKLMWALYDDNYTTDPRTVHGER